TFTPYNPRGELLTLPEGMDVAGGIRPHIKEGRPFLGMEGGGAGLAYMCQQIGGGAFGFFPDFPPRGTPGGYPRGAEEALANASIKDEDKAAILHGNAQRFYRIAR